MSSFGGHVGVGRALKHELWTNWGGGGEGERTREAERGGCASHGALGGAERARRPRNGVVIVVGRAAARSRHREASRRAASASPPPSASPPSYASPPPSRTLASRAAARRSTVVVRFTARVRRRPLTRCLSRLPPRNDEHQPTSPRRTIPRAAAAAAAECQEPGRQGVFLVRLTSLVRMTCRIRIGSLNDSKEPQSVKKPTDKACCVRTACRVRIGSLHNSKGPPHALGSRPKVFCIRMDLSVIEWRQQTTLLPMIQVRNTMTSCHRRPPSSPRRSLTVARCRRSPDEPAAVAVLPQHADAAGASSPPPRARRLWLLVVCLPSSVFSRRQCWRGRTRHTDTHTFVGRTGSAADAKRG